jgi:hypothetical protein
MIKKYFLGKPGRLANFLNFTPDPQIMASARIAGFYP